MSVNFVRDPIKDAFDALCTEETKLESRLADVRSAIASMRQLIPKSIVVEVRKNQVTSVQVKDSPVIDYEGLQFTKALKTFMDTLTEPLTVKEVAERFGQSGFKYSTNNPTNQINVSFIRNQGKMFERVEGGKWKSIRD